VSEHKQANASKEETSKEGTSKAEASQSEDVSKERTYHADLMTSGTAHRTPPTAANANPPAWTRTSTSSSRSRVRRRSRRIRVYGSFWAGIG